MTQISPEMVSAVGAITFADHSIVSLTNNQAAGTDPILAANPARRALVIVPQVACTLTIAPGATTGWPLLGRTDRSWTGMETPKGVLYVSGLPAGQPLTIFEG